MSNIAIFGNSKPLIPGESRHFTLHWVFQNTPTDDHRSAIQRLKYRVENPEGKILFNRRLNLLPEVNTWDIIVEVPPDYREQKITLIVESDTSKGSATATQDILVRA